MLTSVGETRWVGHIILAVQNFLKGYQAIRLQNEWVMLKSHLYNKWV